MRTRTTLAVFAVATATACSSHGAANEVPAVDRVALQKDIAARLTEAGDTPRSVICQEGLVGEVGRIARCDVEMNDADGFEPIATVTAVDRDRVDYELKPALSQAQLEQAVSRLVVEKSGGPVRSVACESGLEGTLGSVAYCDVDAAGVRARRAVKVTDVSGLTMNFNLLSN
jgi:Domain of unknown function (DUF4333)